MIVKNTIYPEWVASQVGCTLVMVKSEAQRRTEAAEAAAAKAQAEVALLKEMLAGRAIA